MKPNVAAMRVAAMHVEELLERAVATVEEGTPDQREARQNLSGCYTALAGAWLERFEEAARGA